MELAKLASRCGMPKLRSLCLTRFAHHPQEWRSRSKRELAELDSQMLAKMLLNAERGFDNWT